MLKSRIGFKSLSLFPRRGGALVGPNGDCTNLTLTVISDVQINLAWTNGFTNHASVEIWRKLGVGGTYVLIYTTSADATSKIAFIGDSIIAGYGSTIPSRDGSGRLFKVENNISVGFIGYGYGKLKDWAETAPKITITLGYITTLLSTATTKKIVITVGTNDCALDSTASSTWQAWYENLLDAINVLDSSIKIYCVSPLFRNDGFDNALLDSYRTAVNNICSARSSYATHIAGKTILSYPTDYSDNVHPNNTGHKKLKDAIYAVMYP